MLEVISEVATERFIEESSTTESPELSFIVVDTPRVLPALLKVLLRDSSTPALSKQHQSARHIALIGTEIITTVKETLSSAASGAAASVRTELIKQTAQNVSATDLRNPRGKPTALTASIHGAVQMDGLAGLAQGDRKMLEIYFPRAALNQRSMDEVHQVFPAKLKSVSLSHFSHCH